MEREKVYLGWWVGRFQASQLAAVGKLMVAGEDMVKGTSSLQGQMQNHRGAEVPLSFKGTPSGHATFTVIKLGNLTHGTSEDILGLNYRSPEASPTVYSYKLGRF